MTDGFLDFLGTQTVTCHIDDIIASKMAAKRAKDLESLPRLQSFRQYLKTKQPDQDTPHAI